METNKDIKEPGIYWNTQLKGYCFWDGKSDKIVVEDGKQIPKHTYSVHAEFMVKQSVSGVERVKNQHQRKAASLENFLNQLSKIK